MNLHADIIEIASEGYFYPSSSIYSTGELSILPITAAQEELLCNLNLAKRGLLETNFLNNIVVGGINPDELLHCDKVSILLNTRIANYGITGNFKSKCEACENEFEHSVSFAFRPIPFNFLAYEKGVNRLRYIFPRSKQKIYFKLPTCNEYDLYKHHGWLTFAKRITLEIEGVDDIERFYDYELGAVDSAAFRKHFENNTPGYMNMLSFTCPTCQSVKNTKLDITSDIYGIKPESKPQIHTEIFDLCYYSNGAFTQEGVYKMPTSLRSFYIKKLVDTKKQEADANKSSAENATKKEVIAKPPTVKR